MNTPVILLLTVALVAQALFYYRLYKRVGVLESRWRFVKEMRSVTLFNEEAS